MPDHVVSLVPRIHESQNAHGIVPERIESIDGSKESKYVHDTRPERRFSISQREREASQRQVITTSCAFPSGAFVRLGRR